MDAIRCFCQSFFLKIISLCLLATTLSPLTACTSREKTISAQSTAESSEWVKDGLIVISRKAPPVSESEGRAILGFAPALGAHIGSWISIDKKQNTLTLMDGDKAATVARGEGFSSLKPGLFQLQHKQRSPLWYAPDSYFRERGLQIPADGDKSRFRRGALGEYVLFINKETPIHSGPLWTDLIGGVKIDEADMAKIYYSLDVNSIIEVK